VALAVLTVRPTVAEERISAGALQLEIGTAGAISARTALAPKLLESARLAVFDGKQKAAVPLKLVAVKRLGAAVDIQYAGERSLAVTLRLEPQGRVVEWQVTCHNTGSEPRWLELGPELRLRPAAPLTVFDGWDDFPSAAQAVTSQRMLGNFPMVACWNAEAALGAGLAAPELVSYFRHEYRPAADGHASLAALVRVVVDPGQQSAVRLMTCAAPGEWGKYELLEAYYASYPACFVAHPGVDPRAAMGSTQYRSFPVGPWSPEICRRLWGGWEWCYAPFRRTGDIVGRPELWDYQPARPFDKLRRQPREEYLAWRRKAFADGQQRCDVAMMFYVPSQVWCEHALAKTRYADALIVDPRHTTFFDTPWVTGQDNEALVFPYGTSFGEQSRKDMRAVAEELDLSGFAFDTAGGVARYHGPALGKIAERAWDDEVGAYCCEMVSTSRLMDFVHTLRRNDRTLAVVGNPMGYGSYGCCFRSDSGMLEATPWTSEQIMPERLRWKMGHKVLVWWEEYEVHQFVDPAVITANQLREVYRGLADYTLLASLRWGYVPPPAYTQGFRRLAAWLPAITECAQAGWQPVPAARTPKPLWAARYGRDLGTLLAAGHETGQPVEGRIEFQNRRLGDAAFLFAGYDGRVQSQHVEQGLTRLPVRVPPRTPVVLRTELAVSPATAISRAEVRRQLGIGSCRLSADLDGRGPATLRIRVPDGFALSQIRFNGKTLAPAAEIHVELDATSRLEVTFESRLFALADRQLLDFPFVVDRRPACTIAISPQASALEREAAFRLQEYFRYWHGRAVKPSARVLLPIGDQAAQPAGRLVTLRVQPGLKPRIAAEGGNLLVAAPNAAELKTAVMAMLRALDTKYPFPDLMVGSPLNAKLGLAGTVLE
jgi:hypothetical protein